MHVNAPNDITGETGDKILMLGGTKPILAGNCGGRFFSALRNGIVTRATVLASCLKLCQTVTDLRLSKTRTFWSVALQQVPLSNQLGRH